MIEFMTGSSQASRVCQVPPFAKISSSRYTSSICKSKKQNIRLSRGEDGRNGGDGDRGTHTAVTPLTLASPAKKHRGVSQLSYLICAPVPERWDGHSKQDPRPGEVRGHWVSEDVEGIFSGQPTAAVLTPVTSQG